MFFQSYAGIITVLSLVYCLLMIDRKSEKINKVQAKRVEHLLEALGLIFAPLVIVEIMKLAKVNTAKDE